MKIRKADEHDAINVAAVGICVWVDTYATEGVFDRISQFVLTEFVEEKVRNAIRDKHVVGYFHEQGGLLGYIVLGPEADDKVEIENLYILPKFQGQGLGRGLIQYVRDFTVKPLWLSVWDLNAKAIGFYRKLGFEETGELIFDLYGEKIRNIVLELRV